MKTLHICAIFHDVSNGPSFSVPAMIKALNENGVVSDLVNLTHQRANPSITKKYAFKYFDYKDFSFKSMQNYDLIVFHQFWEKQFISLSANCFLRRLPYIVVPRGSLTKNALKRKWYKKLLFSPLYFLFLARAKKIHFLTAQEKKMSIYFRKANFTIPNGIEIPKTSKLDQKVQLAKKILYLGRLDPYTKGLDSLIYAVSEIKEQLREAGYTLEMYGSDEPKGGKALLEKLILELGVDDLVKIHPPVYGRDKEQVILSSSFFVLVSRFEGHPMSAIECLSYGLAGVVTRETNIAECIESYGCGFVVADTISEAVLKGITLTFEENMVISMRAKELCEQEYLWGNITRKIIKNYLKGSK
ncbi:MULTISPECIES: glycosyltransferase [Cysteiniphilum]|uniref:glycosyltransferase n=1 Tax=Cysteiniphilum TaxID=2056696 RepID=UPI0017819366|nr:MULTISPECIES: glycosyltransferase [Cysteiniphilum]